MKNLFKAMLYILLPLKVADFLVDRLKRIKQAMLKNFTLGIFFKILKWVSYLVFFPLIVVFQFFVAVIKSIFIIILPRKKYFDKVYIISEFKRDINERHLPLKLSLKRMSLRKELLEKGGEKKMSFGEENPEKIFFVVRPYYYLVENELMTAISGFLFHYYRTLSHISYAIEKGWIPVIDWENYGPFSFQEDEEYIAIKNKWEYFFNQPSKYTLKEVYHSKNVILSDRNTRDYGYIPNVAFTPPFSTYAYNLAHECPKYDQLIRRNKKTEDYISYQQGNLFPINARILGVSIRAVSYGTFGINGTDSIEKHPVQPQLTDLVKLIRYTMKKWDMDYIFFACEYEPAVDFVKKTFGDKVLVMQRKRYQKSPKIGEENPLYVVGQRYQTALDYLTEMVLLSRCTSLLASMSSGTRAAIIWNANRYENCKIIDNGLGKIQERK